MNAASACSVSDTSSVRESPAPSGTGAGLFEPPGGILVWIVAFVELLTFLLGLGAFLVQKRGDPELFRAGQALLSQPLALANTLLLLTGGWFMANAIVTLRAGRGAAAGRWIGGAALTGLGFLVLKGVEYADKLGHGFNLGHDAFFTLYWMITGFHFLHVVVAVILLVAVGFGVRRGRYTAAGHEDVASVAVFWHLCDLIWLVILPVVYLFH